jgi:hypothetical protein
MTWAGSFFDWIPKYQRRRLLSAFLGLDGSMVVVLDLIKAAVA